MTYTDILDPQLIIEDAIRPVANLRLTPIIEGLQDRLDSLEDQYGNDLFTDPDLDIEAGVFRELEDWILTLHHYADLRSAVDRFLDRDPR